MNAFDNLWYARFVRCLLNAADELGQAGGEAVAAKDDKLFKVAHEMMMKLWETAGNLIKNPKAVDDSLIMNECYQGQVQHVGENTAVVLYDVDGKLVEQTYEKSQFVTGELPEVGTAVAVHVQVKVREDGE